jgi:hypothetical protein
VIAYDTAHRSEIETSSILFALAFLALLLFAGALRSFLRSTPAAEGLSALVLADGVLMAAAGALTGTAVEYGLAHQLHSDAGRIATRGLARESVPLARQAHRSAHADPLRRGLPLSLSGRRMRCRACSGMVERRHGGE